MIKKFYYIKKEKLQCFKIKKLNFFYSILLSHLEKLFSIHEDLDKIKPHSNEM